MPSRRLLPRPIMILATAAISLQSLAVAPLMAQAPTTAPAGYDVSTPLAAAQSFLRAVDAADAQGVRQAMLARTPDEEKLADAFASMIAAGRRVSDVARSHWADQVALPGGPGALAATEPAAPPDNPATDAAVPATNPAAARDRRAVLSLASAQVVIDGAHATVTPAGDVKAMRFQQVDGRWLLDVGDYAGVPEGAPDANAAAIADQAKLIKGLAVALNDAADEIAADKFPTAQDAEAAVQQKLRAVASQTYRTHASATAPASPAPSAPPAPPIPASR